jgi:hypothetical protein
MGILDVRSPALEPFIRRTPIGPKAGGRGFEVGDSKLSLDHHRASILITRTVWSAVSLGACSKLPGILTQSKNHAFALATAL